MMTQVGKLIDILPLPVAPPNLKIGRELNRGAWGTVHEGQLDGESVAVKTVHKLLKDAEHGDNAVSSFFDECERLKGLDHPHVIKFRGAFKDAALGPILVMERMKENLRDFLEVNKDKLKIKEQIRISHEITQGVAFLHQQTPPMVHRDLNDKNVMFTFDGVAKIGDFGQSKLRHGSCLTSAQPGMVLYMPPEALDDNNSKYDESLDIFSLGVLMLEIGIQQQPMASYVGIGSTPEIKRRAKDLQKMGDLHPLKPFILLCLNNDQKQRPKAPQMCTVLSKLEENMLQTILAAENRFQRLKADIANHEGTIRKLQRKCKQLDTQVQRSEERAKLAEADSRWLQRESARRQELEQKYTTDLQVAKEDCRKTTEENQRLQMELDCVKTDREDTIRQLQGRCKQLDAQVEANFQMLQRETATTQEVEQTYMTQLLVAVEQLEIFEEKEKMQMKLDHMYTNAIPSNGENDPSESVQQQANESHSPERDPDIQDVNMKDAPRCGQIFQWDQLQPKWTHKCTPSAESDKHIALVDTSEVPLVAKPEECTVTTPDVSTVATPEASTLAAPEAHVTDSLMEQHQLNIRASPSKSEIEHSEAGRAGQENNHTPEQDPDTQDANMKDAPSCEKCGTIFPWNKLQLRWKHKCTGSVAKGETLPKYTGSSTTSGSGESDTRSAANSEDVPQCDKCGLTFPWNQLHLRWKHTCEPTEVDHQLQRTKSSTSRKPLAVANAEQLSASCTVEFGVGNEAGELHVCRCGKTFADNQQKTFMIHKLQCPKGTPICSPGARGATLR